MQDTAQGSDISENLFTKLFLALGMDPNEAKKEGEEASLQMLRDAIGYITDDMTDDYAAEQIRQAAATCTTRDSLTQLMAEKFEIPQIQEGVTQAMAVNMYAWKENLDTLSPDQKQAVMSVLKEVSQLATEEK